MVARQGGVDNTRESYRLPSIFDPAAVAAAHGCCNGSIRRLNKVLTGALRIGAQQRAASVDAEMVLSASQEVSLR